MSLPFATFSRPRIVAKSRIPCLKTDVCAFADPAFTENRAAGIHRWVPWIAGFSAAFVADAIGKYAPRGGLILDPFCGVGTTLVEAVRTGPCHKAVGFEINPYAAFAVETKLRAVNLDAASLRATINLFRSEVGAAEPVSPPAGFRSRIPFYSERVLSKVLKALGWIRRMDSSPLQDLFLLAFGSVMVTFSNYSFEPSLTSRPAVGKSLVEDADVYITIGSKLDEMANDIEAFQRGCPKAGHGQVYPRSWRTAEDVIAPRSVKLLITSPPYANNYHYLRNTRPHLYWLGFIKSPAEMKSMEHASFGKFWQTVRDLESIPLRVDYSELEATLNKLRRIEGKGSYGGDGWANYLTTYFNDSCEFLSWVSRILARGGRAVIVIGNSIVQGLDIRTDEILAHLAESAGLKVESLEVARTKRVGNSIVNSSVRNGAGSKATLYESILTLLN